MLGVLILVHELGHYITGRLLKFRIDEFSVGMGPKIISKEKKGIVYSLRAIPMGGFVAFHGEDGEDDDPHSMNNMPWYKRAVVMFSGAGFNILFAYILTAVLVFSAGYYAPKLVAIAPEAPIAAYAREGDIICSVNGKSVIDAGQLAEYIDGAGDEPFEITALRDGKKVKYSAQKYFDEAGNTYRVGITYGYENVKQNPIQALGYSFKYNVWMTKTMYKTLGQLVTGKLGLENVTGPISTIGSVGGLVQEAATADTIAPGERIRGVISLITELLVIISMNLAIMNLLPIPALDGFRLLFALIEGVTKKHIPRNVEGMINGIGLVALFGLMIVLEVSKLFAV